MWTNRSKETAFEEAKTPQHTMPGTVSLKSELVMSPWLNAAIGETAALISPEHSRDARAKNTSLNPAHLFPSHNSIYHLPCQVLPSQLLGGQKQEETNPSFLLITPVLLGH